MCFYIQGICHVNQLQCNAFDCLNIFNQNRQAKGKRFHVFIFHLPKHPKRNPRDAQGALVFVITDDLGMIIITCPQVDRKSSVLQKNSAAGRKTGPIFLGGLSSTLNIRSSVSLDSFFASKTHTILKRWPLWCSESCTQELTVKYNLWSSESLSPSENQGSVILQGHFEHPQIRIF